MTVENSKYKTVSGFSLRSINCQIRLNNVDNNTDIKELTYDSIVTASFYLKEIYSYNWPWVDIYNDGQLVCGCNRDFFEAQFKKV